MSRETRLLVVTITLSVLVLVVLSRFRFPERAPMIALSPAPLDRLAARAGYDELAAIVGSVQRSIEPSLVVLRLAPESDGAPRGLADVLRAPALASGATHAPALRIDSTTAVAALNPDARILGVVGQGPSVDPPTIIAADPLRRLALVRVSSTRTEPVRPLSLSDLQTPTYVIVVEGTQAGLSFRPLFVGSSARFVDPRWERPLLAVSGVPLTSAGALVFSTEGQFLGAALVDGDTLALAGARDIIATVNRLSTGDVPVPIDAGIRVQALSAEVSAALGGRSGVVVADVQASGAAHGVVQPRDVILSVDGQPVASTDQFLLRVAQSPAGSQLVLSVIRAEQALDVTLTLPSPPHATDPDGAR